ncbi:MAG TPA: hypothetical protein VFL55_05190 [Acetobacteraceae bacterium]|nr:hypothetical protein [Acetobacteraceae bacterium]
MPFDALVAAPRQSTIADLLEDHRLMPVPWKQLAEHKAAQQQKFGPSFWHRHQAAVSILLVVTSPLAGAIAAASGGFSAHSGVLAITGSFVWMCMVALITGTGIIRLRAGAHWEEREVLSYADVPEPIARVARLLKSEAPRARLILGELKREYTVLDPYLLIEHAGECVCLGIWENDEVIACTERTDR